MHTGGEDPTPLFKFWEKLQKNPSFRSVHQLWGFLDQRGIPITKEGNFLAYKSVRKDYKDHHSGQFDNSPGRVNEMPRNQISDDPDIACHDGFHVGALEYARSFGSGEKRIIVCEIDPENVVCVPKDSSQQKMRVCKYKVNGNHNGEFMSSTVHQEEPEYTPEPLPLTEPEKPSEVINEALSGDEPSPDLAEAIAAGEEVPEISPDLVSVRAEVVAGIQTIAEAKKQVEAAEDKPAEEKRAPNKGYAKFDKMDMAKLMDESIEDLRKYAGKGLNIVGASKIPGGKPALVAKILEIRK